MKPKQRSRIAKRDARKGYNTNLAAEFHMMSLFHRAGLHAYLSMSNKKGVDILIHKENGSIQIIEVKGVAAKMDWMIGNSRKMPSAPNRASVRRRRAVSEGGPATGAEICKRLKAGQFFNWPPATTSAHLFADLPGPS